MRLVVFSEADFEPMTIVDVSHSLFQGRFPGDHIRLLPRMKVPSWRDDLSEIDVGMHIVTIRLELMGHWSMGQSTWVGFAADDGLTLKSSLLPGQIADYRWELVS